MQKIPLKAISLNEAYRGRRFKTKKLQQFKYDVSMLLKKRDIPANKKLKVIYIFGLSSKGSDGDNCIKAFQDVLSESYGFNDNKIYKWEVEKVDVKKGEEYIEWDIFVIE